MVILYLIITNSGAPGTGLIPLITIYNKRTGLAILVPQGMTEVGNGIYSYNFTNDSTQEYIYYVDAGAVLGGAAERYQWGDVRQATQIRHVKDYGS